MKENNSFLQSFESGDDDDPKRRDKFRLIMVARKRWVWSYLNSDQLQISTTLDFKIYQAGSTLDAQTFLSFCLSIKYMAHSQLSHPVIHRSIDVTFKSVDPSLSLQSASKLESTSRVCIQTKPNPSHTVLTSYLNRQCHVLPYCTQHEVCESFLTPHILNSTSSFHSCLHTVQSVSIKTQKGAQV